MNKSCFAAVAIVVGTLASSTAAQSGAYPFGDPPYRLNWWYPESQIENGCWKWNWQQYQWDDYCPVYVHPKAYMYPRAPGALLRTRG